MNIDPTGSEEKCECWAPRYCRGDLKPWRSEEENKAKCDQCTRKLVAK